MNGGKREGGRRLRFWNKRRGGGDDVYCGSGTGKAVGEQGTKL